MGDMAKEIDKSMRQDEAEKKALRAEHAQRCQYRTADGKCTKGAECLSFIHGRMACPKPSAC